jgi:hypothetical protein
MSTGSTGTYYLVPVVENPECSDPAKLDENEYLRQVCACQAGVNAAINASNTYVRRVQTYNSDYEAYIKESTKYTQWENCATSGLCEGDYASYQKEFNNTYKNEERYFKSSVSCPGIYSNKVATYNSACQQYGAGWEWVGTELGAKCSAPGDSLADCCCCTGKCKRTLDKAQADWKTYFTSVESKPYVRATPVLEDFNNTSAITCCSIGFDNLSAGGNITISDIATTCSAEVNSAIDYAATVPTGALPPNYDVKFQGPNGTELGLPLYAIILITVVALVVVALVVFVAVRASRRKKEQQYNRDLQAWARSLDLE